MEKEAIKKNIEKIEHKTQTPLYGVQFKEEL